MKNKLQIVWSSIAIISVCACSTPYTQPDAPIKEVPFTQVHLDDNFWSPRIETNRTVSIPSAFKECEKNGRFDNFAIAGGLMKGEHRGDFSFDDTDPYKIIEGASFPGSEHRILRSGSGKAQCHQRPDYHRCRRGHEKIRCGRKMRHHHPQRGPHEGV